MEIRRYRAGDRPQLVALWRCAFPDDPPRNEPNRMIDAKLAVDDLIFVAAERGGIIGAAIAGYDGHRGWLYSVAVDESMRRQRVGSALIRHAVDVLRGLGCIKINLQVRSTNASVVAFYESLGFVVEDRISMAAERAMNDFPEDIDTEPSNIDGDTLNNLGPLRGMAGIWQGTRGLDVEPKADGPRESARRRSSNTRSGRSSSGSRSRSTPTVPGRTKRTPY